MSHSTFQPLLCSSPLLNNAKIFDSCNPRGAEGRHHAAGRKQIQGLGERCFCVERVLMGDAASHQLPEEAGGQSSIARWHLWAQLVRAVGSRSFIFQIRTYCVYSQQMPLDCVMLNVNHIWTWKLVFCIQSGVWYSVMSWLLFLLFSLLRWNSNLVFDSFMSSPSCENLPVCIYSECKYEIKQGRTKKQPRSNTRHQNHYSYHQTSSLYHLQQRLKSVCKKVHLDIIFLRRKSMYFGRFIW